MTTRRDRIEIGNLSSCHSVFCSRLTKTKREIVKVRGMQSRHHLNLQTAAPDDAHDGAADGEFSMLRDIFKQLPTGVTVQDEQGHFLLMNDAAAAQLGITTAADPSASKELHHRREAGLEVLRSG